MIPGLRAFLINLPRSTDRREAMEARLAALGLDHEIVPGVDGRAEWDRLAATLDRPAFERNVGRDVLPGEIGCYHAHLAVWRRFLDTGAETMLAMEDDVVFHPEFMAALQEALRVRPHWDFLQLNCIRAKQPVCQGRAGQWRVNAYLGPATGLGAYLMTRETVARLLPAMLPVTRPIDHELDRIQVHDLRHFGLEPFPSHVDDGNRSTITGEGFAAVRKWPWHRRLPVYRQRAATSVARAAYLARKGRLSTGCPTL